MNARSLTPVLLFLSISSLLPSSSQNPNPKNYPRSSRRFAEALIRDLNLIPGIQEIDGQIPENDQRNPRLVEKKLNLDILGDIGSGISIQELGHHAGYYSLNHTHAARMFYFFFESRGSSSDPLVLWLTGGPGCSSELALFYENGPFTIADNLSLVWNDYGWDKASNIIYVDQPTGTGFSYSKDLRDLRFNEKGVSNDLYDFLQAFFEAHPKFLKNEFYITGESYAGHYIPAVAERVHRGNKGKEGLKINLKGFAIGNGLTNPSIQYGAYADFAYSMGLIGEAAHDKISKIYPICELGIKLCGSSGVITCAASYVLCNSIFTSILLLAGNINYYDIRKKCEGELCYDFSNMDKFLNQKDVRAALGVSDRKFVSCSPLVYEVMITDWMKNLEVGIPALIEDGIKLLIYAGEYDLICNWLGNFRWVDSMEWSGHQVYSETPMLPFIVDGEEAGQLKTYGPLSFLKVYNAGHMVPMDQPKVALDMLKRWTKGSLSEEDNVGLVSVI
ncbi:serine carboxypeptidase-like [Dioscorea cayenensis subsp. rotundata]|uniref:Carboxypeptidase n=1 Tax=Dioscorea cayennensis subsp. rotundata TaxID=55577 RepID=A0AB40BQI6_DIOCR|nr:serine carboxypeptidase-like [Dioscorea cayenensis subsp. rotundata]